MNPHEILHLFIRWAAWEFLPVCAKYGHRFRFWFNIQKKLTRYMLSSVAASFNDVRMVPVQIHTPDDVLGAGNQGIWKRERLEFVPFLALEHGDQRAVGTEMAVRASWFFPLNVTAHSACLVKNICMEKNLRCKDWMFASVLILSVEC